MKGQGMKRCGVVLLAAIWCAAAPAQDMRQNVMKSLFADQKAGHAGDAITIIVVETNSASNDASTNSSRASNFSLSGSGSTSSTTASTGVSLGLGTSAGFQGQGGTSSKGSVQAKLSARVDSVLSNGNLMISGNRVITVNGEKQTITISGIVRPSDIQPDNSLLSYNISDAQIVFEGDGIVSRAQGPGWVTKLLHWLL